MPVIETQGLVKQYGRITALGGVSLAVQPGEIFGLLGPNGAGKTTLVKILLSIVRPTGGEARLLGEKVGTTAVRRRVGYLPEDHRLPEYHTAATLLDFYGTLFELPSAERRRRADESLRFVGLRDRMHYKVRTFSKGMKQRLGLAQALFHDPEVVFLDEPTDGVDPVGRREIRDMMLRLKGRGVTIFLNSHLLGEVEQVCDRVAILREGRVVLHGDIPTLTRRRGLYVIGLAPGQQFPTEEVERHGYRVSPAAELWEVELTDGQLIDPVVDLLRARGLNLRHLVEKRETLENLFLRTVQAEKAAGPPATPQAIREVARP